MKQSDILTARVANPQIHFIQTVFENSYYHIHIYITVGRIYVVTWLNQSQNSRVCRVENNINTEKIMDSWRRKGGPHPGVKARPLVS